MSYKLLDTGYLVDDTIAAQTQISSELRAGYDGTTNVNSFTFGALSISRSRNVNIDTKPVINSTSITKNNLSSLQNPLITFSIQIDRDISNTGYQYNYLTQLLRLEETLGLKLLYPTTVNSTYLTIIDMLGKSNVAGNFSEASPTDNEGTVSTTTPYLVGRIIFNNVNDNNNSKNIIISCTFLVST